MEEMIVLTSWTTGPDGSIYPKLDDGGYAAEWLDITEQPAVNVTPSPNQVVWRIRCDAATADAIQADPNGFVLSRVTI